MSHFSVLAVVDVGSVSTNEPEDTYAMLDEAEEQLACLMAPYDENSSDPDCLVFVDCTQEVEMDYATGTVVCVKTPDGRLLSEFDREIYGKFEIQGEEIVQCRSGQLHHPRRSRKAKKYKVLANYPLKKRFPTLEAYAKDFGYRYDAATGRYGYDSNPAAKWDWYTVGGRWEYRFLVKEDCQTDIERRRFAVLSDDAAPPAPAGYRWTSGARKNDIQWDMMKEIAVAEAKARYARYKAWFEQGEITGIDYPLLRITEEGIRDWDQLVYVKGETQDDYLTRTGMTEQDYYLCSFYAAVTEDGWESIGEMGWFGISHDQMEERAWHDKLQTILKDASEDAMLISVDCHT